MPGFFSAGGLEAVLLVWAHEEWAVAKITQEQANKAKTARRQAGTRRQTPVGAFFRPRKAGQSAFAKRRWRRREALPQEKLW